MAAFGSGRTEGAAPALRGGLEDGALRVTAGDRPLLTYHITPVQGPPGTGPLFTRNAYVHPVHAPNGAVVTGDFVPDHPHQRGVFFAWTKTTIGQLHPDFWNIGAGTARIRCVKGEVRQDALGAVRLQTVHHWEMRQGEEWKRVLEETWDLIVRPPAFEDPQAPDAAYVLDLTSRQNPLVDIELPQYRYGGMAVRGTERWAGKTSGMKVLTSEGKDRVGADGAKARWVDMSGPVDGKEAGIALLEDRSNPRAPGPVRMHPDVPYYVFSPIKDTGMVLDAGRPHVFRYRLVAHNGPADPKALDTLWQHFARP